MKEYIVLSLFDGMSCAQIALKQLGITPTTYYASEIDKHAIGQTQLNFPETIQLGSVVDVDIAKLKHIDILFGGSPCQSFSFAGKRKGMATKCEIQITKLEQYLELKESGFEFEGQSYLFWEYMRILTDIRKYNPEVKFLLENVEMGAKWERVLSEAIGIYGVHINSALVSAQNRKRIYWTNIRTKEVGLFGELHANIPQPKDKGILLKDILESEVPEKYYLSDKMDKWLQSHSDKKQSEGCGFKFEPKNDTDKANAINQRVYKMGIDNNYIVAMRGREACLTPKRTEYGKQIRKQYESGEVSAMRKEVSQLEPREDGKTNTLTTVQKDNLVIQLNQSKESGGLQPYQQNRVYDTNGISPCLNTDARPHAILEDIICHNTMPRSSKTGKGGTGPLSRNYGKTYCLDTGQTNAIEINTATYRHSFEGFNGYEEKSPTIKGSGGSGNDIILNRIRRLTPTECARLQTVPDWYIWKCSNTQQYRMLGNGWTIDVIEHILSFL